MAIKSCTIVIGDDHHMMAEALRSALSANHKVRAVAHDGEAILDAVRLHKPDLLLLDMSLPGRSGLQLLPEVLRVSPATKVIVVTMHLDRLLAEMSIKAGASGFVPKDAGLGELETAIDVVTRGATFISRRVPATTSKVTLVAAHAALAQLTPRQHEIVKLIAEGHTSGEIAQRLGLSERTVAFHRANIKDKLGVDSTLDLMRYAVLLQFDGPLGPSEADPTGISRRGRSRDS